MKLKKGYKQLIEEAEAVIETVSVAKLKDLVGDPNVLIIDLRDVRERAQGFIPGSKHVPRGMLEFWVDPESPYFRDYFSEGKRLILHCSLGWRSALAAKTLREMGVENVAHLEGGLAAWEEAGGAIEVKNPIPQPPSPGKGAA